MPENQLSGFLCLEKIGKRELLSPANVVVDGNADRRILLSATVVRSQSVLTVLLRAAAYVQVVSCRPCHI